MRGSAAAVDDYDADGPNGALRALFWAAPGTLQYIELTNNYQAADIHAARTRQIFNLHLFPAAQQKKNRTIAFYGV